MATAAEPAQRPSTLVRYLVKLWRVSTADYNIALYGLRRFKTAHLVNLRLLEAEMAELDHKIYQAGLSPDSPLSPTDRLGLESTSSKRDKVAPPDEDTIARELVLQLRDLTRDYDDALLRMNRLLSIDTFSLIDDAAQCGLGDDLTMPTPGPYQHMVLIADIICRIAVALGMAAYLIAPMNILAEVALEGTQIVVVWICIIVMFASLVLFLLRMSNLELMLVSAAYAAILSEFISNVSAE